MQTSFSPWTVDGFRSELVLFTVGSCDVTCLSEDNAWKGIVRRTGSATITNTRCFSFRTSRNPGPPLCQSTLKLHWWNVTNSFLVGLLEDQWIWIVITA